MANKTCIETLCDGKTLTFFAVSDFGVPNENTRKLAKTMSEFAQRVNQPSFILGLGDNFYPSGVHSVNDAQFEAVWRDVFLKYEQLRVPWRMVLGNHDYIANPQAQVDYTHNEKLNVGGFWQMPDRCYNFRCSINASDAAASAAAVASGDNNEPTDGDAEEKQPHAAVDADSSTNNSATAVTVEFFMLDTCGVQSEVISIVPEAEANLRASIEKLDMQLAQSTAQWKIVAGHHCMYTQGQ